VVNDFCARFLPLLDMSGLGTLSSGENATLSAEAMEVLQSYFGGHTPAPHRWYGRRAQRFKALVRRADAVTPGWTKPRRHPGLGPVLEARTADLAWLHDRFGVTFPEIPSPAMSRDVAETQYQALRHVADICTVDNIRLRALNAAMTQLARAERAPLAVAARALRRERLR